MTQDNIDSDCVPIHLISSSIFVLQKCQYQIFRKQFPVVPAEALTVHKSQGQTFQEVCLDLSIRPRITNAMMYVALSRVTKISGLYIIGEFILPKTSRKDNGGIAEKHRLRREREMELSCDNLCNRKDKVIYQNVGSLNQTFGCIMADEWYSQVDI